jgi:predicted Zn-dependent peptidase
VPIDVFVVGDVAPERVAAAAGRAFDANGQARLGVESLPPVERRAAGRVRRVTETREVAQGKLAMGYRTTMAADDPAFPALMFCNAILGGGTFSKLFRFLREAASLAYYAHSQLERAKGLLSVHAGIDSRNLRRALRIIHAQLRDIREGRISDFEMGSAREQFLHRVRSIGDSPSGLIRSTLVARICGRPLTARQAALRYRRVTREEVVDAARTLSLDTVFFLRSP